MSVNISSCLLYLVMHPSRRVCFAVMDPKICHIWL